MRRWSSLVWLVVPAFALAELAGHQLVLWRLPAPEDFVRAAELVRDGYREGDLVVVAPEWAAGARVALGDEVLPLRDQARADEAPYSRLWEVSIRGARAPEARDRPADLDRRFGRVRVRRVPLGPSERVVADFLDLLEAASVRLLGARAGPCRRVGTRFRCEGAEPFRWVGTETISDLDHRPRRCIWAHPPRDGRTLRIDMPPASRGEVLVGHTAVDYVPARHCGPDPVRFSVLLDGIRALELDHRDCDGFRPFSLEVPARQGPARVSFEVAAPPAERRHFCFQAQMRDRP